MTGRNKLLASLRASEAVELRRMAVAVALTASSFLIVACGSSTRVVRDEGAPPFCEPVKNAYRALFEIEGENVEAYERAAHIAAQDFRAAAKSAPPEVAEAIQGLAAFYEEAAESSDDVGLRDIQDLLGHSHNLRVAVKDQCGFTIDGQAH